MNDILKSLLISFLLFSAAAVLLYFILFTPTISKIVNSFMNNQTVNNQGIKKDFDLEKFSQAPEKYLNTEVSVMGKVELYSDKYNNCPVSVNKLTDENGYRIKICVINKELQQGKTYTLKGKITKDIFNSTGEENYVLRVG